MRENYQLLSTLEKSDAYKKLMILWMEDLTEIEVKRDVAAAKGQESGWRYWAGQEKGYKRAMMRLNVELSRMEEEGGEEPLNKPSEMIEKLLAEARGETEK